MTNLEGERDIDSVFLHQLDGRLWLIVYKVHGTSQFVPLIISDNRFCLLPSIYHRDTDRYITHTQMHRFLAHEQEMSTWDVTMSHTINSHEARGNLAFASLLVREPPSGKARERKLSQHWKTSA